MSRIYGVVSHATLRKQLKQFRRMAFCTCCRSRPRTEHNYDYTCLNDDLVKFLSDNHLGVMAMEQPVAIDGVTGRVDCIFLRKSDKRTLFIVDWKFLSNIPADLPMDYVVQLNLYMYMMKRMKRFEKFDMTMWCLCFSSRPTNKSTFKAFSVQPLPENFIRTLITKTNFY